MAEIFSLIKYGKTNKFQVNKRNGKVAMKNMFCHFEKGEI